MAEGEKPTEKVNHGGMTRRDFLRGAGLVAGAAIAETTGLFRATRALADVLPDSGGPFDEAITTKEKLEPFSNKVGWAYSAKPETSLDQMIIDMQRMKDLGSNVVYISHLNPGYIDDIPAEPGLAYAVYDSIKHNNTSLKTNGEKLLAGVNRALEAADKVGLPIVLAIGYQIQMGTDWAKANQDSLRKAADGSLLRFWDYSTGGVTASPYSPVYRQDIEEYYQWVNDTIISKHPNILAINLGDEPMGSDYSDWAKAAFKKQYGVDFDDADPFLRGKFQAEVLADHAAWSAELWKKINPDIKTLFTFHIQRTQPLFPSWEAIFAKTPDTFVFSNDTHMHDDLPDKPMTEEERNLLYGMVRTISWLSNVYGKGFMPWEGVNGWSLANLSSHKGGIPEAEEGLRVVTDIAKQNGAILPMVMAWGWNFNGQGIFGYDKLPFDPNQMATTISQEMLQRRDALTNQQNGRPDIVYYFDPQELYARIGEQNVSSFTPDDWFDMNQFDFINQNAIWLSDGPALEKARQAGSKIILVSLNAAA